MQDGEVGWGGRERYPPYSTCVLSKRYKLTGPGCRLACAPGAFDLGVQRELEAHKDNMISIVSTWLGVWIAFIIIIFFFSIGGKFYFREVLWGDVMWRSNASCASVGASRYVDLLVAFSCLWRIGLM